MTRKTFIVILLLLAGLPLHAQFYMNGDDPGHLRWRTIETPHYQMIYPAGGDSLARVYGRLLEQFRVPVGRSFGTTPGEGQRRKMPVILHTYNPYSNGSVGWAPRRMDLYTLPDAGSDPVPWPVQLASHEPRHQAQFQSAGKGWFKLFNVLSGEAWNPVAWQVYYGWALGEGDAVVAETGLWNGGTRARTADFLNYYRVALDQGDYRNWFRWRYGSYKHYTPDHYALGYLTLAGARYLTGNPLLMKETVESAVRRPLLLSGGFRDVLRRGRGGTRFNETFREIQDTVKARWAADDAARAPFLEMEQLTEAGSFPLDYAALQMGGDGILYAFREGYARSPELVSLRDGCVTHMLYVNGVSSALYYDSNLNRLYWTERRPDARWKQSGTSVVCCLDLNTGKAQDLAAGHIYYNPQPSEDGALLAAAEYTPGGESYVALLSADDGQAVGRYRMPDGLQAAECAWLDKAVYFTGVSVEGYGLYRIAADGSLEQVLAPSIQKMVNLDSGDGSLEWISDRTGVNELYRFFPLSGRLLQMTSTRYGISDSAQDRTFLYSVSQTLQGDMVFRTPITALEPREAAFGEVHSYFLADAMTAQERALGPGPDIESAVPVSAPKRYYKLLHPLRLHSWLPLYVNYDAVKEGSADLSYKTASIGLSAFFQNTLGTVSGMLGYGLHRSPDNRDNWRNALHVKLAYTGQFPVLEASLDVGDRAARQYFVNRFQNTSQSVGMFLRQAPLVEASFRAYIPLSVRRYGVTYGFIPQISYTISNNGFAPDPVQWVAPVHFEDLTTHWRLKDAGSDENVLLQRLSASVRGYAVLSRAENQEYPRLGIGAELGASVRPGLSQVFTPNIYAYAYGYLPGLWSTQGLKLTALVQRQLRPQGLVFAELAANTLPRGFEGAVGSVVAQENPLQWRVTADYAIPIYVGDISIPGIAYIKNFVLTPHGDFSGLNGLRDNLWSAGADLSARMAKLIIPFDTSLGVSFSYLGGSWYKNTGQEKPWSVELIFGMDF